MLRDPETSRAQFSGSTSSARGRVAQAPRIQVLPCIATEEPYTHQGPTKKYHPEREMRPWLHSRRSHAGKIPLGKRPDELPVKTDAHQCHKEEGDQSQHAHPHRVKQDHRPMVHTCTPLHSLRRTRRSDLPRRRGFAPDPAGGCQWR